MNIVVKAGGVATITEQIHSMDSGMLTKAARGLARGLEHVIQVASLQYLSGPRPQRLDVVTTRLRKSITRRVIQTADSVRGVVGTNVVYAGYHELGFRGAVSVRAHTRTVAESLNGLTLDSRRPIRDKIGNLVGFKENRTKASRRNGTVGLTQQVNAHTRNVNYAGRPFLSPALKSSLPIIVREIRAELSKTTPA